MRPETTARVMNGDDKTNGDDPMQSLIGKQLRSLYDSVLVEPIPDRLVELLLKLDDVSGNEGQEPVDDSSSKQDRR